MKTSLRRAVIAGILSSIVAGCGDQSSRAQPVEEERTGGLQQLVDAGFASFAATDDFLIAFSAGDADRSSIRPRVAAVPLSGGAVQDLAIPGQDGGLVFSPTALVASSEEALLLGKACAVAPGDPNPEAAFCARGKLTAFRVNPSRSELSPVRVDGATTARLGLTVTGSQRTADGWQLFASRFEQQPVGPVTQPTMYTAALKATLDGVTFQNEWTGGGSTCSTRETVFQLQRRLPTSENGVSLDSAAALSLVAISLRGGAESSVALPKVSNAFGGANVSLGCSQDAPFLSTAIGDPQSPIGVVYRLADNGDWQTEPELVPAGALRPNDMVSDYGGLLIPWQVGRAEEGREATSVVPQSQPNASIDQAPGEIWRGSTSERIKLNFPNEDTPARSGIEFIKVWS